MDGQKDATMEKRKHDGRDAEKHKERYNREPEAHVKNGHGISSGGIERDERNEQYQGKTICVSEDEESSAKKPKLFNSDKRTGYVKDETVCKVTSEHAHSFTSEAEAANDLNAAKVAAMKAAELVNRNLIGGGYMSTDQKKKLLWGNKKNTTAEEVLFKTYFFFIFNNSGHCWDMPVVFNKLMVIADSSPYFYYYSGCEGRRPRWECPNPNREVEGTPAGFREAVYCWTPTVGLGL
ncbi:hypothetical protein HHK36_017145 [Tetracentron sinense]|uniref:Uncharacterized protein n=1 Tax=Tetracentron sinense TaxID=13715 RepID=A0A834YYY5_TETSI|nr:hypothetical protein HHK36_017145 [Tetracentron sinense]